ncbi:MAG: hypothetical protein H7287_01590 [Thermoleophilia bacterium]|nr:hypothetical protein [Thermoleophilia bacterium]
MLSSLVEQFGIIVAAVVLLGVPGAALVSLLRVRAALPDTLAVPAGAMLGAAVAAVATAVQLVLATNSWVAIGVHGGLSAALALLAVVQVRSRRLRGDAVVPVARGWGRSTTLIAAVSGLIAWYVRGGIKLDGLYHVSVSRKLVELAHPTFSNINRFSDGGPNPTYALPSWHAFVGWCGQLTGSDPIVAWQMMPVVVVVLAILTAAGFARVVLETERAEPLGAFAWALTRIFFARREVDGDGITFGAVPGQITFELVFPILFAAIVVGIWTPVARVRRSAIALAVVMVALIVVFHANYVPYVAIVGLGYVAWWLVTGPFSKSITRRTLAVGGAVAAACAVFLGALLPLLAQLDNFGNAPEEARIDYHLTKTFGMEHITGGHLFDLLGWTGLPLIIVMPWVAAKWRSARFAIVPGGILAMATVCFVPPLYHLLAATGSLTVGLRINHIFGVLLMPVFAASMLMFADLWSERLTTRRRQVLVVGGALAFAIALGAVVGYRSFLPDPPGYAAWLALVVIWVVRLVRRVRARRAGEPRPGPASATELVLTAPNSGTWGARRGLLASPRTLLAVLAVAVLGLGIPIGLVSFKKGVYDNHVALGAPITNGALSCLEGVVGRAVERLPAQSIVLSDPALSFQAMALAPVYVVGDYKVWNSPTKNNKVVERLASVNRFFDTSAPTAARLQVLSQRKVDYLLLNTDDTRWFDHYRTGKVTKSDEVLERARRVIDSFSDMQGYSGGAVAELIAENPEIFTQVALDPRGRRSKIPPRDRDAPEVPCNSYGLWKVDEAEVTKTIQATSAGLVKPGSFPNSDVPAGAQG